MTNTLFSFLLFWAIWLLVPLFIDGSTAAAYLWGAWKTRGVARRRNAFEMDDYPMVTVIIPVYNGQNTLGQCLASLRAQTYPRDRLDVLVVDNQSTDSSFAVFREAQATWSGGGLNWMSVGQKGKAYALNAGIHVSMGSFVANIDCDVVLHPDAILNMMKAFAADKDLAAATGSVEILPGEPTHDPLRHIMTECEFMEYYTGFHIGRQYQTATDSLFTLAGAFSVFRREVLLKTYLYDKQTVSEDTKLTFELHQLFKGMRKACVAEAVAYVAATPSISAMYAQRVRWQRGQLEVTALFPEFLLSPFHVKGLASSKSLVVDHTLAFARVVWTFLLPMLYFVGYPLTMVFSATLIMYVCYMAVEGAYWGAAYLIADPPIRERLKSDWWLLLVMPVFRFTLFWFRFGGFLSVLLEPAEWRVKDPFTQTREAFEGIKTTFIASLQRWKQALVGK
jgi:biofilm PGA synthesis N-glycosyltransferase PgaC